jgi:transcriptional regulator with XRE-family HTH domain
MTPFGEKVRELRRQRGVTLKQLAGALELSPAYLSALEHGHRGRPTPAFIVQICEYFHLIWDDYEEMHRLARLSHPRVVVDTRGLSPTATELANLLSERIGEIDDQTMNSVIDVLRKASPQPVVRAKRRRRYPRASNE